MTGPVMRHQPAPAIDLGKFRDVVVDWRERCCRAADKDTILNIVKADRLLALIDGQTKLQASLNELLGNPEQLPPAPVADPEDVRIVRIIAEKIDEGRLDHPGFYKNGRLSAALRNLLALIDGQAGVRSSSEHSSEVAADLVTDAAVRRLVRAMENTPGDELIEPNTRLCRRLLAAALQPTKGEGVLRD